MATYDYDRLEKEYDKFYEPIAMVKINNKEIPSKKVPYVVSDYDIDLTCGYEASIASFSIYKVYDDLNSNFDMEGIKDYIMLGSKVEVYLGYKDSASLVFVGVIAKVNYQYLLDSLPCIRVTAMDVKGLMMAGTYSRQLKADNFIGAVKEIFENPVYKKLKSAGIIKDVKAGPAIPVPTVPGSVPKDFTIEMVDESDYEFVVKMAKRNNYEFFTECGIVYFRKAKENTTPLIALVPRMGIQSFDIEYDITALSETIYARNTDVGKGEVVEAKGVFTNSISIGNKAQKMIKGTNKVYIDPSITDQKEAQTRVDSIMETMSFKYGTLYMDMIGLPEMKPGYFIDLQNLGTGPSNVFYITNVQHLLRQDGSYITRVTGKTNSQIS